MLKPLLAFLLLAAALPAQSVLPAVLFAARSTEGEASVELVDASGASFKDAFRITTAAPGRALRDASLTWTNAAAVQINDRLTLTFWVRKIAPEDVYNIRATVSLEDSNGTALLDTVFPVSLNTWAKYSFPISSA